MHWFAHQRLLLLLASYGSVVENKCASPSNRDRSWRLQWSLMPICADAMRLYVRSQAIFYENSRYLHAKLASPATARGLQWRPSFAPKGGGTSVTTSTRWNKSPTHSSACWLDAQLKLSPSLSCQTCFPPPRKYTTITKTQNRSASGRKHRWQKNRRMPIPILVPMFSFSLLLLELSQMPWLRCLLKSGGPKWSAADAQPLRGVN